MAEQSLFAKCYLSIATIKRAELCCSVSPRTLERFAIFFDVRPETLIKEFAISNKHLNRQQTTIHWHLVSRLAKLEGYERLTSLCGELQTLLNQYAGDEHIQEVFQHDDD